MIRPILTILAGTVFLLPVRGGDGEFRILFDGSGLAGWKQGGNWAIEEDGSLARTGKGGNISYTAEAVPDDFELTFEWKVAEGSNSGVYYRPGQYEYQILDNDKHSNGTNPRTTAASLYFCMAPSHDATNPVGEWNTARIVAKGSVIQHWLNGEKVVAFDYEDPRWQEEVALLRERGGRLESRGAHLSLQDHGDPVWFRNIRIREIPASEEVDATPVTPADIPEAERKAEQEKLQGIRRKREEGEKK